MTEQAGREEVARVLGHHLFKLKQATDNLISALDVISGAVELSDEEAIAYARALATRTALDALWVELQNDSPWADQ
jgi:hypothetical protein